MCPLKTFIEPVRLSFEVLFIKEEEMILLAHRFEKKLIESFKEYQKFRIYTNRLNHCTHKSVLE